MGEFGEGSWIGAVQLSGSRTATPVELRTQRADHVPETSHNTLLSSNEDGVNTNNVGPVTAARSRTLANRSRFSSRRNAFSMQIEDQREQIQRSTMRPSLQDKLNRIYRVAALTDPTLRPVVAPVDDDTGPALNQENALRNQQRLISNLSLRTSQTGFSNADSQTSEDRSSHPHASQELTDDASRSTTPNSQETIVDPELSAEDLEILIARDLATRTYDTLPPPRSTQAPPPIGHFTVNPEKTPPDQDDMASGDKAPPNTPSESSQAQNQTTGEVRSVPSVPQNTLPHRPPPGNLTPQTRQQVIPRLIPGAYATFHGQITAFNFPLELVPRAVLAVDPKTDVTYQIPVRLPHPWPVPDRYSTTNLYRNGVSYETIHSADPAFLLEPALRLPTGRTPDIQPQTPPQHPPRPNTPVIDKPSGKRKRPGDDNDDSERDMDDTPNK